MEEYLLMAREAIEKSEYFEEEIFMTACYFLFLCFIKLLRKVKYITLHQHQLFCHVNRFQSSEF